MAEDAAEVVGRVFDEAERRDPGHERRWVALVDGNNHQIDRIEAEAARAQGERGRRGRSRPRAGVPVGGGVVPLRRGRSLRRGLGARPGGRARRAAVLDDAGYPTDRESLERAHRGALAAYQAAWRQGVQFRSPEATRHALEALGVACDVNTVRRLERCFTEAGLSSDVEPVEGALEAVTRLHGAGVRLGVICDIGLTPSEALEPLLDRWGVRDRFDALIWSDRIGAYKPDRAMFGSALDRLGVPAGDAWHVGDRRRTDVAGAVAAGMTAVRFRAVYDDPEDLPDAPMVVGSYEELLRLAGLS